MINFSKLCVRDDQLFRDTSMRQLISQYDYMHTLLASNLRWMFGHLNELLLPDDLFEEILTAHEAELKDFLGATPAELRSCVAYTTLPKVWWRKQTSAS